MKASLPLKTPLSTFSSSSPAEPTLSSLACPSLWMHLPPTPVFLLAAPDPLPRRAQEGVLARKRLGSLS